MRLIFEYFVFKLNLDCYDVIMQVEGRKNKFTTSLRESPCLQDSSSGSYQQQIIKIKSKDSLSPPQICGGDVL